MINFTNHPVSLMKHNLYDVKTFPVVHLWQTVPGKINLFSRIQLFTYDILQIGSKHYEITKIERSEEANPSSAHNNNTLVNTTFYELKVKSL